MAVVVLVRLVVGVKVNFNSPCAGMFLDGMKLCATDLGPDIAF